MYAICIYRNDRWETVAHLPYAFEFTAIVALTRHYTEDCDNICIEDAMTGEIYWDWAHDGYGDEPDDDDPHPYEEPDSNDPYCWDEVGFNPYEGCYDYDC